MHVSRLSLQDFRSYAHVEVELTPGPTAFVGRNGQGKTNLVEAVDYLSRLSSHRVAGEAPLIRAGAPRAIVRAAVVKDGRTAELEVELQPGRSNVGRINRSQLPRVRDLVGLVRTVVFSPEDLALVKGDPGERRRLLDDLAVLRTPRLAGTLADYDRILRQRSTLLKSAGGRRRPRTGDPAGSGEGALATLDVWDDHLARVGAEIMVVRAGLVAELLPHVGAAYATVARGASRADAHIAYRPSFSAEAFVGLDSAGTGPEAVAVVREALAAELVRRRGDELDRGVCLVGPHRDEVVATLGTTDGGHDGGHDGDDARDGDGSDDGDASRDPEAGRRLPVKGYASHGESWSFALALRLASYDLLRAEGDDPILILDDVFAELDTTRRDQLAARVAGAEQVLVTAAVEADVPPALAGSRFRVAGGTVTREG